MSTPRFSARILATAATLGTLIAAVPAQAQTLGDRQLLSTAGGKPYVMILFDTSGSMNWATQCTAADVAIGRCNHLCSAPNCPQPMNGDDSESKVFQAKKALYEVMLETEGVRWGFASLNQDQLAVSGKHWLYKVTDVQPPDGASDGLPHFPALDWQEVFGAKSGGSGATAFDLTCDRKNPGVDDNNAALYETGCYMTSQDAPVSNTTGTWTLNKLKRLPKGGLDGTSTTKYFLTKSGSGTQPYYRVTYSGLDGSVAGTPFSYSGQDTLTLTVNIDSCPSNKVSAAKTDCTDPWTAVSTRTITYSKVGQFLFWEGTPTNDANLQKNAQFGGRTDGTPIALSGVNWANDATAGKTCRGWEPSGTSYPGKSNLLVDYIADTDPYSSYNLRWPDTGLVFDPDEPGDGTSFDWIFQEGDIIPLNWVEDADMDDVNDNKEAILKRLNPLHPIVDDKLSYAEAPYFADSYQPGETFLRLKDEAQRPLVSLGSTPLAGWFSMFRKWYSGCGKPGNCTTEDGSGWQDIAALHDPTFNCSKKYVLMITDGAETCDGSPQENAEDYYQDHPDEFPDGFSKTADQCRYRASLLAQEDVKSLVIGFGVENKAKLQCANTPVFYADTAGELKDLLLKLIGEILEEAATFASAAVPTVQANILDKVYLSSFIPLQKEAVWPGRLDAFLKPLPLDQNNLPDHNATCAVGQQSECFAWDGGDSQLAWNTDLAGWTPPQGLLAQAPFPEDILRYDNSTLKIGDDAAQRRVFFGRPDNSDLGHRRYFQYPTTDTEWTDLEFVWNITDDVALSATRKAEISDILEFTLEQKRALIDRACTAGIIGAHCDVNTDCDVTTGDGTGICSDNVKVQYVMGDIFHSNPAVINPPSDFELFTKDLYWNTPLCGRGDTAAELAEQHTTRGPQISYSWYSNKNICRRVMVAVGSDDGQLHVFDGGIIRDITPDDPTTPLVDERVQADCLLNVPSNSSSHDAGLYDDDGAAGSFDYGSGREIFSFIPQSMMPLVKELSGLDELTTQYGIDGSVRTSDVFIDPAPVGGVPECEQRTWRTLLFANYREGGPGFAALDITQPDTFDSGNQPIPMTNSSPSYVPSCIDGGVGCDDFCRSGDVDCGALPFPALKWEFRDIDPSTGLPANDDGIGGADLAESWSRPLIIRHPVCDGTCDDATEAEDHWFAVFGGGLSEAPTNDDSEITGNWVYMVDVETGKVVYKRGGVAGMVGIQPIEGAVPSDVTGVDFNVDGIVDTLYFGTTAGFVYKVDLGDAPWELDVNGQLTDPVSEPGKYRPYKIFTTGGKPIYLEINTVYVPKMRANALLFGTGIRWDLWDQRNLGGRFYAIVDSDWKDADHNGIIDDPVECNGSCTLPIDEQSLISIDPDTGPYAANYLYGNVAADKLPGWYFPLPNDEKLITEPFTLSGVTFFTIFSPTRSELDDSCALGGESKIFVINTVTTKGYAVALNDTTRVRYTTAPTFTTQPYVEASATKNKPDSSSTANADSWTSNLAEINSDLRKLFPPGARFANYTLDIKTIRKDTGIVFVAPVPVAIEPHNWKEF